MKLRKTHRSLVIALYVNAALLAAILLLLLGRDGSPRILSTAMAQNQLPIGGGAGVFIVPAQFSQTSFGCYLMDIDAQTLCAYQYFPPDRKLQLLAARSFRYDRRLQHFNTGDPTPLEAKDIFDREQAGQRVLDSTQAHPPVEAPAKQE